MGDNDHWKDLKRIFYDSQPKEWCLLTALDNHHSYIITQIHAIATEIFKIGIDFQIQLQLEMNQFHGHFTSCFHFYSYTQFMHTLLTHYVLLKNDVKICKADPKTSTISRIQYQWEMYLAFQGRKVISAFNNISGSKSVQGYIFDAYELAKDSNSKATAIEFNG